MRDINYGLLNAAARMGMASGPSKLPTSFGQIAGQGLLGYTQGKQYQAEMARQKKQDELNKRFKEAQMSRMEQLGTEGAAVPSKVAEYEYLKKLNPKDRELYFQNLRAGYTLGDQRYSPTDRVVVDAETVGGSKATASNVVEKGKDQTAAQIELPTVESNSQYLTGIIDTMLDHPGLAGSVGVKSPGKYLPGTKESDFGVLLDQVQGKVFMQAYQSLKGGGQITEIESEKATAALARLNTAQSEGSFKAAANEFKTEVQRLTDLVRQRAGQTGGDIESLINQYAD